MLLSGVGGFRTAICSDGFRGDSKAQHQADRGEHGAQPQPGCSSREARAEAAARPAARAPVPPPAGLCFCGLVSLAAPRMAQSEGRAHVESCRAVSHRRSTRSLKRGLFPCSGVTVVVRAGRPGCTTVLEHAKELAKVRSDLQEKNPCTSAYEVRTSTGAGSALGTAFVLRWLCRRRLISRA